MNTVRKKVGREVGRRLVSWVCLTAGLLLLAGCRGGAPEPVAIAPDDMCASCRMAISDRRFAAELVDAEGEPFKFDDVACLIDFVKGGRHEGEIVAYFVTDFEDRRWIAAAEAHYVQSPELKTPMNGGVAAFRSADGAREAAARYHGTLRTFDELFGLRGRDLRPSADVPAAAAARHDSSSLPAGERPAR